MQVEIPDLVQAQKLQSSAPQMNSKYQGSLDAAKDSFNTTLDAARVKLNPEAKSSGLGAFLEEKFDGKSQVNEEDVYQALVEYNLNSVSPDVAKQYAEQFQFLSKANTRSDGYIPVEELTNKVLDSLISSGDVSADRALSVKADAFKNAQLDNDCSALWDSIGGGEDKTVAVAPVSKAIEFVDANLLGERHADLSVASAVEVGIADGTALSAKDGSGGFLWKPVADSNGRLVVLLPTHMNGYIKAVEVHSNVPPNSATLIGTGKYSNMGNGGRCHFRFPKPGSGYGNNVHLVVWGTDGSYVSYNIPRGGSRWD